MRKRTVFLLEVSVILIVVMGIWGYQSYSKNKTTTMQKEYSSLWKEENSIPQIEIRTDEKFITITDEEEIKLLIDTFENLTLKETEERLLENERYRLYVRVTSPHRKQEGVVETTQFILPIGEDIIDRFHVLGENHTLEHIEKLLETKNES